MNSNSQVKVTFSWNVFGWFLSLLMLTGCGAEAHFTTPFCGPGSVDSAPMVELPAEVQGCYMTNYGDSLSNSFGSSIVYPMTAEDLQYIDLRINQGRWTVGVPGGSAFEVNRGGICANPMASNGRSFITMYKEKGWWSAQAMEFAADWSYLQMTNMTFDRERLQKSGIRYALFPKGYFRSLTGDRIISNSGQQPLGHSLGMVMIDNHSLPLKDLMAAISFAPRNIRINFTRVDDSKCQATQLKYYQMAGDGRLKAVSRAEGGLQ